MSKKLEFILDTQEPIKIFDVFDYERNEKIGIINFKKFKNSNLSRLVSASTSKGASVYIAEFVVDEKSHICLMDSNNPLASRALVSDYFKEKDNQNGVDFYHNRGINYLNSVFHLEKDRMIIFNDRFAEKNYLKHH